MGSDPSLSNPCLLVSETCPVSADKSRKKRTPIDKPGAATFRENRQIKA